MCIIEVGVVVFYYEKEVLWIGIIVDLVGMGDVKVVMVL